jgi:hypothetical protein
MHLLSPIAYIPYQLVDLISLSYTTTFNTILQADSLFDYYARESPEEAWTDKSEFH